MLARTTLFLLSVVVALHARRLHGQEVVASREPRLQQLVGQWLITKSTFGMPADGVPVMFVATAVADGRAVRSMWTQGRGATYYEASALWAYSAGSREVRVFEANTLGVAETHVGGFDSMGVLRMELRDPATGAIRESRTFTFRGDTILITASFGSGTNATRHSVTMVRQP